MDPEAREALRIAQLDPDFKDQGYTVRNSTRSSQRNIKIEESNKTKADQPERAVAKSKVKVEESKKGCGQRKIKIEDAEESSESSKNVSEPVATGPKDIVTKWRKGKLNYKSSESPIVRTLIEEIQKQTGVLLDKRDIIHLDKDRVEFERNSYDPFSTTRFKHRAAGCLCRRLLEEYGTSGKERKVKDVYREAHVVVCRQLKASSSQSRRGLEPFSIR